MNYIRTSGGSMMPVSFKAHSLKADKKQTTAVKPKKVSKKSLSSRSK